MKVLATIMGFFYLVSSLISLLIIVDGMPRVTIEMGKGFRFGLTFAMVSQVVTATLLFSARF